MFAALLFPTLLVALVVIPSPVALRGLHFLGCRIHHDCQQTYLVRVDGEGTPRELRHVGNGKWLLDRDPAPVAIELGQPGDVFEHASMQGVEAADDDGDDAAARAVRVRRAAPHWPESYVRSLASCGISGQGMIAFDADFFLSQLTSTAMDHPLLFPHAAAKLELNGLRRCEELMAAAAVTLRCGRADVSSNAFAEVVQRAQRAQRSVAAMAAMARDGVGVAAQASDGVDPTLPLWDGGGRLIGEYVTATDGH